jgi:hypothetical protein
MKTDTMPKNAIDKLKCYIQTLSDYDKEFIEKLRNWAIRTDNQPMVYKILFKTITGRFDDWENRKNYEKYTIMSKVYWHYSIDNNWEINEKGA